MLTVAAQPPTPFASFDISLRRSIVAAVSGGSDSTALLLLLREHLAAYAPSTQLVAVTVDHALRAESAAEAETVATFCTSLGIEHHTLAWTGPKPTTGIPAAAREARYRLLAEAAREAGSDIVFTGHTADDQLETVAMRASRGDGRGLAGMAPATLYAGATWICRPLLGARREALRAYLRGQNVGWIDDPSNINKAFERPRMRQAMVVQPDADDEALAAIARASAEREALGMRAASLIDAFAEMDTPGAVHLAPPFVLAGEIGAKTSEHPLTPSLTAASPPGSVPLPHLRQGRGAPIAEAALLAPTEWGRGGSGEARVGEGGIGSPDDEPAAIYALRLLLATVGGSEHLPDFERVAALFARLGEPGLRATLSRCVVERRKDGIRIRRERRGGAPIPAETQPRVTPFARFLPSFDLVPAATLAALVGAPPLPPPPFS